MQPHHKYALTRLAAVAAVMAVAVLAGCYSTRLANGATVYEQWRFRDGTVCVNYSGTYWPMSQAVNDWNTSDVTVVRRDDCAASGFSRDMTVRTLGYQEVNGACAKTASEGDDNTWAYVYSTGTRYPVWVPNKMTIWFNLDPSVKAGCYDTLAKRTHVVTHELGHALGLAHSAGGVMGSWSYQRPTACNIAQLNERY